MTNTLVTVDEAAKHLNLHPKTVLRYIHEGRLEATRIGKSYRIARGKLDSFAGVASARAAIAAAARTTCIVDIPEISVDGAQRLGNFLHAAAMAKGADRPRLHVETAFDPLGNTLKVVMIGSPADVGELLQILELHETARS
jgi:excisionase family DNA binding protein